MHSSPDKLAQQLQEAFATETRIIDQLRSICRSEPAGWVRDADRRASRLGELPALMTALAQAAAASSTLLQTWKQAHAEVPAGLRQANEAKVEALKSALREVHACCAEAEGAKQVAFTTLEKSNQLQESLAAYAGK